MHHVEEQAIKRFNFTMLHNNVEIADCFFFFFFLGALFRNGNGECYNP